MSVTYGEGRKFRGRIVTMTADALTVANGRERLNVQSSEIIAINHPRDGLAKAVVPITRLETYRCWTTRLDSNN